jgi:hypothetical protein
MECNGLDCSGLEWNALEWIAMDWNGINGMKWIGLQRIWNGMEACARATTEDKSFNRLQRFQPTTRVTRVHQTTKVSTEDKSFYILQRFQTRTRVSRDYRGFNQGQNSVEYDGFI